jgi:hypothetical protein
VFYVGVKLCVIAGKDDKLRVFENRVLRGIFCPKREEVAIGWRKLHNEEHYDLYCPANIM